MIQRTRWWVVGLAGLPISLSVAAQNAETIARYLEQHRRIERVHYPGLESHRDHEVARRLMSGFGGVISFEVRGSLETASKFIDASSRMAVCGQPPVWTPMIRSAASAPWRCCLPATPFRRMRRANGD